MRIYESISEFKKSGLPDDAEMVYFETSNNPTLRVVPIAEIVEEARRVGAKSFCDSAFPISAFHMVFDKKQCYLQAVSLTPLKGRCSLPPLKSRTSTHGRNMAGARGLWRATGMKDGDFGKPIVAIVNSFTQFVLGHVHLKDLGQMVARQVEDAGGVVSDQLFEIQRGVNREFW